MAEIIAIGRGPSRQSRRSLREGQVVLLGRAPRDGWAVPWDRLISREHAQLTLRGERLEVRQLGTARNPVLFDGQVAPDFVMKPDDTFRIGDTSFHFRMETTVAEGDSIVAEHLLPSDHEPTFLDPTACLRALCQMPTLIADSAGDADLADRVVALLLESITTASAAAVMRFPGDGADLTPAERDTDQFSSSIARVAPASPPPDDEPELLRWSSRRGEVKRFRPSRRLIRRTFERQQSVVHLWIDDHDSDGEPESVFTLTDNLDWAFCTPISTSPTERWCLYVSGRKRFADARSVQSPKDLVGELRLAEMMARFVGAVRRVRSLEHQQNAMRQFFSPAVVETLAGAEASEALEPRLGPVSVLFCDVRGFSRRVESSQDNLRALLDQVSMALSVMSQAILKYEGVIADFQGDAALGFWGWPSASPDAALLACRAALLIHNTFHEANQSQASPAPMQALRGYRVGIGLGHGPAIAGRIGSREQIKVGVFGPVVNLTSRLEELTKFLGVPILLDGETARAIQGALGPEEGQLRRVPKLRPRGIDATVDVFAL
ncbi:MAG: adenylate/guanylate cyclase domain-containing protein, partial [Planctomycetota bacterium]